jgi:Tfp pilus assembly protein PilW
MNLLISHPSRRRRLARAMTLIELMVASGLGSIVMAVVASLTIYGAHTFSAMSNYVDLDLHSRNALDVIGRELREATAVSASQTNPPVLSVTLTNTDAATGIKLTWDSTARTLVLAKSGQPDQTCLTECDNWTFSLFNRAPNISSTNITFNTAADLASCKLINMSWKCSRTILGAKLNTESVQTAQIVLRNKIR